MSNEGSKALFSKKFVFSIILHGLHGFIFEKSKLHYPFTYSRNLSLVKTDMFKFYLSVCMIFFGLMYFVREYAPAVYASVSLSIEHRYRSRNTTSLQIGSYLMGVSMLLIGFCPTYLPIYLAISPVLFLYSAVASYTAYIFYHVFVRTFFSRLNIGPINNDSARLQPPSKERETLTCIRRIILIAFCVLVLLLLETSEQSVSAGHLSQELPDLIRYGDYIPPGLTGVLCGLINFTLIFVCEEYGTLTGEWLMNIFYYTSEYSLERTHINGQLCFTQLLKIISMACGARLSLWTSKRQEVPSIDWLYYALVGCGSFISAFSICLTTATFTDHVYLISTFADSFLPGIISQSVAAAWVILYSTKLFGIFELR